MSLTTNIVSYWKFNESSGNAADSVGSNTLTNTSVTYGTGKINNGAIFNGSAYYATTNVPLTGTSNYSVNFWFYQGTQIAANTYVFYQWGTASSKAASAITYEYNSGTRRMDFGDYAADVFYTVTLAANAWTMITKTYDGSNFRLYLNGSLVSTQAGSGINIGSTKGRIGVDINNDAGTFAVGTLDEMGVWSRALSGTEITTLYNSGAGLQYPFVTIYTMTCSPGSFSYVAKSDSNYKTWKLLCSPATFAFTAIANGFKRIWKFIVTPQTYTYTGLSVIFSLAKQYILSCLPASFSFTGLTSGMKRFINFIISPQTYTYTGLSVIYYLTKQYILSCLPANYNLTRQSINSYISKMWKLVCTPATYIYTGIANHMNKIINFICSKATYLMIGQTVGFMATRVYKLVCQSASYIFTGLSVVFDGTGSWLWRNVIVHTSSWINKIKD